MSILQKSTTVQKIQEVKHKGLFPIIENSFLITILQGFSRNALYRLGFQILAEYEKLYVSVVEEYIREVYGINIKKVIKENSKELIKVKRLQKDIFIQTILCFQTRFNYFKRWLKVENTEQLSILYKIFETRKHPLLDEKISKENFENFIIEAPYVLYTDLLLHNLIYEISIELRGSKFVGEKGVFPVEYAQSAQSYRESLFRLLPLQV